MKLKFIFFSLFFLLSVFVFAQDEKPKWMEFRGYIKDLQTFRFVTNPDTVNLDILFNNRLNFKFNISQALKGRLEVRNLLYLGDQVKQVPDFGRYLYQKNELFDLSWLWADTKSIAGQSVIDRVNLQYSFSKTDITVGRQRINWGMTTVWNPNDIFNAYNFLDFEYEERPGTDAVRVQYHPSTDQTLEAAVSPRKESEQTTAALLYKFNKWQYDVQFLGGIDKADAVLGTGWAGNIGEAGFKGEVSYFHPYKNPKDTSGTLVSSLMIDYSTKNAWYLSAGTLINISEWEETYSGPAGFAANLSAKTLTPYRYNYYLGAMKTLTPILSMNLTVLYAPKDQFLVLYPAFTYNAAENFDIDVLLQSFFAQYPTEFEVQSNSFFIRLKKSF